MHNTVLLRIVAVSLLLYSLSLFASSLHKLEAAEKRLAEERLRLVRLAEERAELEEKFLLLESDAGLELLARERLELVMPGEKVFYFTTDRAAPHEYRGETAGEE